MLYLLQAIDFLLLTIEAAQKLNRHIQPLLCSVWQAILDEKTQRILRAVGLAALVLGVTIGLGIWKVVRLAWQDAIVGFRSQLKAEVHNSADSEVRTVALTPEAMLDAETLTVETGVRELRKITTQRGIRNAGRMRKGELLAQS